MIQITLASGRTVELKKALFKRVAEFLATEQGFRKEDVLSTCSKRRAKTGLLETGSPKTPMDRHPI